MDNFDHMVNELFQKETDNCNNLSCFTWSQELKHLQFHSISTAQEFRNLLENLLKLMQLLIIMNIISKYCIWIRVLKRLAYSVSFFPCNDRKRP